MKKLTISFVLFIVPLITMAQTNVSGNVVDAESYEPLVGASIIIKDDNGKIIKFTTTKDDGTYTLQLSSCFGDHIVINIYISMVFLIFCLPLHR